MFIGDLVKLKSDTVRNGKDKKFVENAKREKWIWLITGMDDEDLDYSIQPLYLEEESYFVGLGAKLLVLYDEIETVQLSRNELFKILNSQRCNC